MQAPVGAVATWTMKFPTVIPGATSSLVIAPMSMGSGEVVIDHFSFQLARLGCLVTIRTR